MPNYRQQQVSGPHLEPLPQLSEAEYKERLNVIRRPTEALAQIASHPNLLRVLQFDELPSGESGFYEVTEWSEFGTLHGYLNNASPQLTVRERLEIAAGSPMPS
jgi:hypothetical protein